MPIQVASSLIPKSGAKWFVVEDTYLKGGIRVVADAAARDAIYSDITAKLGLKIGMLCVTANDFRVWQYVAANTWTELKKSKSFTFSTETPLLEWDIQHNFNSKNFTYSVFDDAGFQIVPNECQIVDVNNLKITFLQETAGSVTLTFNA